MPCRPANRGWNLWNTGQTEDRSVGSGAAAAQAFTVGGWGKEWRPLVADHMNRSASNTRCLQGSQAFMMSPPDEKAKQAQIQARGAVAHEK